MDPGIASPNLLAEGAAREDICIPEPFANLIGVFGLKYVHDQGR